MCLKVVPPLDLTKSPIGRSLSNEQPVVVMAQEMLSFYFDQPQQKPMGAEAPIVLPLVNLLPVICYEGHQRAVFERAKGQRVTLFINAFTVECFGT